MLPIARVGGYATPPWAPITVPRRTGFEQISHLSTALTQRAALHQRNVLNQCGVGNEHVGTLFIFAQYAAKAASLAAAMPALWLSPDYATLVEYKRVLRDGGLIAGGANLYGLYQQQPQPLPQLDLRG
jgi:hypothetical protein